jgi:LmbE family N-acetylglucosaminyl deacetylase
LHVYLSPHLDDAVLSCGAAIHQRCHAGDRVVVLTIFAGAPDDSRPLASHARLLYDPLGTPDEGVSLRRDEDRAALALLGAEAEYLHLPDCVFRCDPVSGVACYGTKPAVFGAIHPQERELPDHLAELLIRWLRQYPGASVYAPLAVGSHVDHLICRRAASRLHEHDWPVCYYEEFPYCDPAFPYEDQAENVTHSSLDTVLAEPQNRDLGSRLHPLSDLDLEKKITAIKAYESQLAPIFSQISDVGPRVRTYAESVGSGKPAERLWKR